MQDFSNIVVKSGPTVSVSNYSFYKLIGKGSQGAVFRILSDRCVKIYSKESNAAKEAAAYLQAQDSPIVPKLYDTGPNYIVIEYIDGPSLSEYLKGKASIPESITRQILFILKEVKRLGFPRRDWSLRHILVTNREELKVIDLIHALKERKTKPKNIFQGLYELGILNGFLEQVKVLDIETYMEWKESMSKYYQIP